jgi:predicted MarR family transcription regulator
MKIEKLIEAVYLMKGRFNLDLIDLVVLHEALTRDKQMPHEVTIMEIVDYCDVASPATIHSRIKKLCAANLLKKTEHPDDVRFKVLTKGDKYDALVKELAEV